MKLFTLLVSLLSFQAFTTFAQYPEATITNGEVTAHLYLPDARNGFYRGVRFDWSGVVSSLKYKGHDYFGQWYANHNPTVHDAIQGPVEAFDPIGYNEARPGENFLKIGVGIVTKVNDGPYRFNTPYELKNGGVWKVKTKKDRVEFTHVLNDPSGYAYVYTKTVRLAKNRPQLILEHRLKNTGSKSLVSDVLNHNFLVIDKQPTGPDFEVKLGFDISNQSAGKELIRFDGNELKYLQQLTNRQATMEYPEGFSISDLSHYDFTVRNKKTGAGLRITSDRPLSKFMYWSVPTTLSPEPFIRVAAEPGKSFDWKITYSLSAETQ